MKTIRQGFRRGNDRINKTALAAVVALLTGTADADVLPTGFSKTAGDIAIDPSSTSTSMTLNQTSSRALIDWSTFNIGESASVNFNQPGSSAVVVNRISAAGGQSIIDGALNANGHVMLLNPNGVMFGATASVNVAGLIASTGNIQDDTFIAGGNFSITGATQGTISNAGSITVSAAGLAAFVAPAVSNSGTIVATSGRISLTSAEAATISFNGGLYELAVNQAAIGGSVNNTGTLSATGSGGVIALSALDASTLLSGTINLDGVQQANIIVVDGNHVVLRSDLNAPVVTGNSNTVDVYSGAQIQDAIDIATSGAPGATINVRPGNYTELATNRDIGVGGIYDLGLLVNKDNLTIRGVDTSGNPITNADDVQAWVTAGTFTNFGMHHGVLADNVTIEGMGFLPNAGNRNKTVEIAGDNFAFRNSVVDNRSLYGGATALYFGELLAGPSGEITRLTVTGSKFLDASVVLTNGVGVASDGVTYQPISDRVIANNTFTGSSNYTFGGVLLNGKMDEVPWRLLPIGAPTITGNSFSGFEESVLVRGDQQSVDLRQVMTDNVFDRAVLVTDAVGNARAGQYLSLNNVTRDKFSIQSRIQAGIDRAVDGDTVRVGSGQYAEQLTVAKSVNLLGAGADVTVIRPASLAADADGMRSILTISGGSTTNTEVSGFTIKGPVPEINAGIFVRDGAHAHIHGNKIVDMRESAALVGNQRGQGIFVGRAAINTGGSAVIENNVIAGYQKGGIVIDGPGSQATITGNWVTGEGPTAAIAQNGIQISRGASANVSGNTVSGNDYTPANTASAGILIFTPGYYLTQGNIVIGPNTVTGNEVGISTNDPRTLVSMNLSGVSGNAHNAVAHAWGGYTGQGNSVEFPAWNAASSTLVDSAVFGTASSGDIFNVGDNLYVADWSGFSNVQPAIDAVATGGTVNVAAGSYVQMSTLKVNKSLALIGGGEAQTTIDARGVSGYGINVTANDVSLSDFTLYGPSVNAASSYGIKVAPSGPASARLQNFSVTNVTSRGAGRAELDLNGVNGALIDGVTANGAPVGNDNSTTPGAGIQLTDSANVTVRNSRTQNNAWGGIALYQANRAFDQQVANIAIEGTNQYTEALPIYLQDESATRDFGALTIAGPGYAVRNEGSANNSQYTWLQSTLDNAVDYAVNTSTPGASYIQGWNGTGRTQDYYVGVGDLIGGGSYAMSIGTAINAASSGANIYVGAGTFNEGVTLAGLRNITFDGTALHSLTLNSGAGGSGIGGNVTATGTGGFVFNAPVRLLSDTSLITTGANIALNGDIQNASATSRSLVLKAGSGTNRGNILVASGGMSSQPLDVLDVLAGDYTLQDTLWVNRYTIDAAGSVALSDHTLRALASGVTNLIQAGGNISGSIVSNGSAQLIGAGDVVANITVSETVTVSANNVRGNIESANVVVEARSDVQVNVNANTTTVHAGGNADLSGSSTNLVVDASGGSVTGNFEQVSNVGDGVVTINGRPQVSETIDTDVGHRTLITESAFDSDARTYRVAVAGAVPRGQTGKKLVRVGPEGVLEQIELGNSVELDLSTRNGSREE